MRATNAPAFVRVMLIVLGFMANATAAPFVSVAPAIDSHVCAVNAAGAVTCWGDNSYGELGNGTTTSSTSPIRVPALASGVVSVALGQNFSCALTFEGAVACWGSDYNFSGTGSFYSATPVPISGLESQVVSISAGEYHACAIKADGSLWCWGDNPYGELGNGTTVPSVHPSAVLGLSKVKAVAPGRHHTCALTELGAVYCWGSNASGQLGNGTTSDSAIPVQVSGLSSGARAVTAGAGLFGTYSCAVDGSGAALCWGTNGFGQLGNGLPDSQFSTPVRVTGLSAGVSSISAGYGHTCVLTTTGGVKCWGFGYDGQLGDGTLQFIVETPTQVVGLESGVVQLAVNGETSCAITTTRLLLCWGGNDAGQEGNGTLAVQSKPAVVLSENGMGSIAGNDWFLDLDSRISKSPSPGTIPPYLLVASKPGSVVVADVRFRASDLGNPIHVFVYAPSNFVTKLSKIAARSSAPIRYEDGPSCVLSQFTPSGDLQQTSASDLQPYASNVQAGQQQSVTLLSSLSAQVPGAIVCVGTGTNGVQSVNPGNSRCAVSIPPPNPGDLVCLQPTSNAPGPLSGLWWNSGESGWGIDFTQRRDVVFVAWYTYDMSGNPKWYVASNCTMAAAEVTSGTCSGALYEVNGPAFLGTAFNASAVNVLTAGSLSVNFQDANNASMTYTVGNQTRTVAIARQPISPGSVAGVDYTDLWWNPNESGWGMAIAQQGNVMFLAWYIYDGLGRPMWYVASDCAVTGGGCTGTLYRTTGPAFGPNFDSTKVQVSQVGTITLSFTDPNNGLLTYTVDGVSGTKTITRQVF